MVTKDGSTVRWYGTPFLTTVILAEYQASFWQKV